MRAESENGRTLGEHRTDGFGGLERFDKHLARAIDGELPDRIQGRGGSAQDGIRRPLPVNRLESNAARFSRDRNRDQRPT
jgi:hypothetical protein